MSAKHAPAPILEHLRAVGNDVTQPLAMHTVTELFELQGFIADGFGIDPDATPPRGRGIQRQSAWTSPACKYFAGRR